ncbi:MAG TPA: superoxide dismutase [Usitatibacter sp.]|nr:superoxide dismutase [Usitatibacter sp.]
MAFKLPPLPYELDALEPYVSRRTMEFHYHKHHQGYVAKLNGLTEGTRYAGDSLEDIIHATAGRPESAGVFNNAAQVWNHAFFWQSMKRKGGGKPPASIAARLDKAFGSFDKFHAAFEEAALGRFGSGWTWLVAGGDRLEITTTSNAGTPLADGTTALLTCDVWEHAYYLDYQNRRGDFVKAFLDHLVSWDHVAAQLGKVASSRRSSIAS